MCPEAVSVRPTGAVECLDAEAQRQLEDGPRHLHRHEAPRHQHDLCAMNYDSANMRLPRPLRTGRVSLIKGAPAAP